MALVTYLYSDRIGDNFIMNKELLNAYFEAIFLKILFVVRKKSDFQSEFPKLSNGIISLLTLQCIMSQNGQTHFKNFAANAARFLKCV